MTEQITIETLLTVVGATLVAGLLVQVTKIMWSNISDQWTRRLSVIYGVVIMVLGTLLVQPDPDQTDAVVYVLAVLNGLVAGLAASAGFETVRHGDARVVATPSD